MLLNLYFNKNRIRDIVFQLNKNILSEVTRETKNEFVLMGGIKGTLPKWIETLGFGGEASVEANGKIGQSNQKKFSEIDLAAIEYLKETIKNENYLTINDYTVFAEEIQPKLVRTIGEFKPIIEGRDGLERVANFRSLEYLEWERKTSKYTIRIGTSTDSFQYRTPIYQCLSSNNMLLNIDFFGIMTSINKINDRLEVINLLPVFMGVKVEF